MSTFNVQEYQFYEKIENGDMNWIIPGKFLAFSTPVDGAAGSQDFAFPPEHYVPIFKKFNIGLVVRLNNKEYDAQVIHTNILYAVEIYQKRNSPFRDLLPRWVLSTRCNLFL